MKIAVYGAGYYAKKYLPKLQREYEIAYILDQAKEKQGQTLYGIEIVNPDQENVNQYPIIILIDNTESGCRALRERNCGQKIYMVIEYVGGYGIFPYEKDKTLFELLEEGRRFQNSDSDFSKVSIQETSMEYLPEKTRYFDIASSTDFHAAGGPCACLRNLWLSNEEFHLIDNFYTLCPSAAYVPRGGVEAYCENPIAGGGLKSGMPNAPTRHSLAGEASPAGRMEACNEASGSLRDGKVFEQLAGEENVATKETLRLYLFLQSLWEFLGIADGRFHFKKEDVFLLQDPYMLQVFLWRFPDCKKVVAANHSQGTMGSEMEKRAPELHGLLDKLQNEHLKQVKEWIFPSKGALHGFLATGTEDMRQTAKACNFHVAYNGYEPKQCLHPDLDFLKEMEEINQADVIFASATYLYRNKGVERIPRVLAEFRRISGLRIHWILVGSGEMAEDVCRNINHYLREEEYTWYKERFDNQDNIFALFEKADFYIMMHKVSVFDLSILQAMAYGCVPFLSNIGGNLELCGFGNGIMVDAESGTFALSGFLEKQVWNKEYLAEKQNQNRMLIRNKFNNRAFLEGYKDVLYQQ